MLVELNCQGRWVCRLLLWLVDEMCLLSIAKIGGHSGHFWGQHKKCDIDIARMMGMLIDGIDY